MGGGSSLSLRISFHFYIILLRRHTLRKMLFYIRLRLKDNRNEAIIPKSCPVASEVQTYPFLSHFQDLAGKHLISRNATYCIYDFQKVRLRIPFLYLWDNDGIITQLNVTWNDGTYYAHDGTYCAHELPSHSYLRRRKTVFLKSTYRVKSLHSIKWTLCWVYSHYFLRKKK